MPHLQHFTAKFHIAERKVQQWSTHHRTDNQLQQGFQTLVAAERSTTPVAGCNRRRRGGQPRCPANVRFVQFALHQFFPVLILGANEIERIDGHDRAASSSPFVQRRLVGERAAKLERCSVAGVHTEPLAADDEQRFGRLQHLGNQLGDHQFRAYHEADLLLNAAASEDTATQILVGEIHLQQSAGVVFDCAGAGAAQPLADECCRTFVPAWRSDASAAVAVGVTATATCDCHNAGAGHGGHTFEIVQQTFELLENGRVCRLVQTVEVNVRIGTVLGSALLRIAARKGAQERVGQQRSNLLLGHRHGSIAFRAQQWNWCAYQFGQLQRQSHDARQRDVEEIRTSVVRQFGTQLVQSTELPDACVLCVVRQNGRFQFVAGENRSVERVAYEFPAVLDCFGTVKLCVIWFGVDYSDV